MATTYQQPGDVITWTNGGSAVSAGDVVVIGNTLGVALVDIAGSASGSVALSGVHQCPKVSGAVIAQGDSLTWDISAGAFDDKAATAAAGDIVGAAAMAFEAAGNGVTTLAVKLTGAPGTVATGT